MTQCLPPTQIANNSIWGMFKPTLVAKKGGAGAGRGKRAAKKKGAARVRRPSCVLYVSFGNAKSQKEQNKTKTTKNIERQQNMVSLRLPDGSQRRGEEEMDTTSRLARVLLFIRNEVL